jgi:hypothetical protein
MGRYACEVRVPLGKDVERPHRGSPSGLLPVGGPLPEHLLDQLTDGGWVSIRHPDNPTVGLPVDSLLVMVWGKLSVAGRVKLRS